MKIPPLVHVRAPADPARASVPPASGSRADDVSARTMSSASLRRELQSGGLPRETEVLFPGLGDWTPASEVPELWQAPPPEEIAAAEAEEARASIPISSVGAQNAAKKGFGASAVIGGVFAAIALLAVGATAIYFVYFHYKPVAVQHLPRKCMVAARVDLLDWAFFDPLTKKLAPAIDQAITPPPPPGPQPPAGPNLKERLKTTAGIDIDRGEIREVAACVFEDKDLPAGVKDPLIGYRAIIAIGGRLKVGAIPKIFEAAQIELHPLGARLDGAGESAMIRIPASSASGGIAFVIGQAEDGTIIVAPSDKALTAARDATPEEEARANTNLRQKGAFELSISSFVFRTVATYVSSAKWEPILKPMREVDSGWFAITTGKSPKIDVSFEQKNDEVAKGVEKAVREILAGVRKELDTMPKDWAGEHAAVGTARVARDDTRIDVHFDFQYPDVDRGAGELSDQLKDPASPFRTVTLPKVGIVLPGTTPAAPAPSASTSASGASTVSPSHGGEFDE
ncbi:MAG: DUF4339 domain-containing protein [Polyangiales bacterium]